jgi:8-hydroxy-5-deazaflavin:NADPH oxidoreductase
MARIAFVGGTGPEGIGLAIRFAKSGNAVFIGSRTEERAEEAVHAVQAAVPAGDIYGGFNHEGAEKAEFIFITVPYAGHAAVLQELAEFIDDKIVVDAVVPLTVGEDGPVPASPPAGSAAQEAQELLPKAKVVSAFHHLDGKALQRVDSPMQGDVIVCSDHKAAKKKVLTLVEEIEYVRGLDGGGLANSAITEAITVLLIHINKIYKAHSGIRITGV